MPEISNLGGWQFGGTVVLALGLVEVIKLLINKFSNNKGANGKSVLTPEEQYQLQMLSDMHAKTDEDGMPVWYVPRSWGAMQEKMVETLRDIASNQDKMSDTQERQTEVLDKIVEKLSPS